MATSPSVGSDHSPVDTALTLARHVTAALRARHAKLATAESCTGGMIGALVTDVPGSSQCYLGGVVAYANEVKVAVLQVPPEILDTEGAVSAATADAMAIGVRRLLGADIAVSVTGIAGPSGGTAKKPVGLVFIGVATAEGCSVSQHQFAGGRVDVRAAAAATALRAVLNTIDRGKA